MQAWSTLSWVHSIVWGPGLLLFTLSFFGQTMASVYRYYMEYILSNLNYLSYLAGIVILSVSSDDAGLAGFFELLTYSLVAAGVIFFVELVMGVKSLQALDRSYPWDDVLLLPQLFYSFGWLTHRPRGHNKTFYEHEEEPFEFENDPSVQNDIPIDDFYVFI